MDFNPKLPPDLQAAQEANDKRLNALLDEICLVAKREGKTPEQVMNEAIDRSKKNRPDLWPDIWPNADLPR